MCLRRCNWAYKGPFFAFVSYFSEVHFCCGSYSSFLKVYTNCSPSSSTSSIDVYNFGAVLLLRISKGLSAISCAFSNRPATVLRFCLSESDVRPELYGGGPGPSASSLLLLPMPRSRCSISSVSLHREL